MATCALRPLKCVLALPPNCFRVCHREGGREELGGGEKGEVKSEGRRDGRREKRREGRRGLWLVFSAHIVNILHGPGEA